MIALVISFALAGVPVSGRLCTNVVDRAPGCEAPADVATAIAPDVKRVDATTPEARWDVSTLPFELGFVSAGLALGGGAALVLATAPTPNNDDERLAQEVARYTGTGLLVWSALVGAGAAALAVFDPSSGALRLPIFPDHE